MVISAPALAQAQRGSLDRAAAAPVIDRDRNCFDFLRLFAALTVVVHHAVGFLHVGFLWVGDLYGYWFFDGVPLFFILSGFLVYRASLDVTGRGLSEAVYFTNRFLRVAPALYAYTAIIAVAMLVLGILSVHALLSPAGIRWIAGSALFFPVGKTSLFPTLNHGNINGSLWTIPVEVSFYLVVPFAVRVERRFGTPRFILLVAALALLGLTLQSHLLITRGRPLQLYDYTFLPYLTFFGLGIFWLRAWTRVPKLAVLFWSCLLLYVLLRVVDPFGVQNSRSELTALSPVQVAWYLAWAISLSYAVIWLAMQGPAVLHGVTRRIGDLSYGTYIWHAVVIDFVLYLGVRPSLNRSPEEAVLAVILLSLLLAFLSWRWIERPFLRRKPVSSRPPGDAPWAERRAW